MVKASGKRHLILLANHRGRDFVCGDLHGCLDDLMVRLREVRFDFECDRLFALGDLIDRGPESLGCLRLLSVDWFFSVRGNHDQMMLDCLLDGHGQRLWYGNGGTWYETLDATEQAEVQALCQDHVQKLPLTITIEYPARQRIGLVHADPPDDWKDAFSDKLDPSSALWGRQRIRRDNQVPVQNVTLVFAGHTPGRQIRRVGNVLFPDTGAGYQQGTLTVVCLKDLLSLEG